ncbi:Uncharacterized protein dnm_100820 [Desulfonema magnum]|uniref:Uncharacterized protein n=1 Tax=Desulfonema magnum TaxID=45655 RepID=A0A975GUP1_9BACT|nr:Uncharacterized protein dnm_100820 [Desulfonema magnum]
MWGQNQIKNSGHAIIRSLSLPKGTACGQNSDSEHHQKTTGGYSYDHIRHRLSSAHEL